MLFLSLSSLKSGTTAASHRASCLCRWYNGAGAFCCQHFRFHRSDTHLPENWKFRKQTTELINFSININSIFRAENDFVVSTLGCRHRCRWLVFRVRYRFECRMSDCMNWDCWFSGIRCVGNEHTIAPTNRTQRRRTFCENDFAGCPGWWLPMGQNSVRPRFRAHSGRVVRLTVNQVNRNRFVSDLLWLPFE